MLEGDSNSKYFYAHAPARKRRNYIHYLKSDAGEIISDKEDMCNVVREYFVKVFSQSGEPHEEESELNETVITDDQNRLLTAEFTLEEFSTAIKEMHPDKSAGPDDLNPVFFQNF